MAAAKDVQGMAAVGLGDLLDDEDGAIVTLVAGNTRLAVHRAVLVARSPVFMAMFGHDMMEATSGHVAIPDVEGPELRQLVAYLYTLQAPQLSGTAPQLLAAADKYGVLGLKAQCEQHLSTQLTVENAAATAVLAVRHSCSSLRRAALAFIKAHAFEVMATQGWAEAMFNQPKDLTEVSQLLCDPPAETRAPATIGSGTTATNTNATTATTAGAFCQPHSNTPAAATTPIPPPDEATISQMRSLSAEERGRRLRDAAKKGEVHELRALLAAGADVEARDGCEMTALHCAADMRHVQAASCLLKAGAEVGARNIVQNTPLHWAAYNGHASMVQLLLKSSADPNARDQWGRTPLHIAAQHGRAEVAAALLEAGADRGARTNQGETPLDLARQRHKHKLIQMLS